MTANETVAADQVRSEVRKHYGQLALQVLQSGESCCGPTDSTRLIYEGDEVGQLPLEVRTLSAGCGDPVTLAQLEPGQTVLDLGSGGGIDCFLAAQRVGEDGYVIGVDMTPEMLSKARANQAKLGLENVEFRLGEIEHLPVADGRVDVILSNCVINLSPDKPQVFAEAFRVLRSGGRLAVSDIVADGPLPEALQQDPSSWSACVAGAMDYRDVIRELERVGFVDVAVTPQRMDGEIVSDYLAEADVEVKKGDGQMVANVGGEWVSLDLGGRRPPFSARITGRKP